MYIALKPCTFAGKKYKIGEPIADGVVLREAAPRLCKMGMIAAVGVSGIIADSNEGGPLLPPSSTIDPEKDPEGDSENLDNSENSENQEGDQNPEKDPENPEQTDNEQDGEEEKTYSKSALSKMNKDELLAVADEKGVEATAEMTNAAIVELILAAQGE